MKPVNSHNEWDTLEEIIVGHVEDSIFPEHHISLLGGTPRRMYDLMRYIGGFPRRPKKYFLAKAQQELDDLVKILEKEGVKVKRPSKIVHRKKFRTPNWKSRGHTLACPRDCFLVIGDEIIEAPMSWRNRYFEREAYYNLFKEYFDQGARWTSAPRPLLRNSLYNNNFKVPKDGEEMQYVINESEIVFDAADFARAGKDIFVTLGNVTNTEGVKWLERHLGDRYKIHRIPTKSHQPMHIDTTLLPMGPKKILINPKYIDIDELPPIFNDYDILIAPEPLLIDGGLFNESATMCGTWLNMNVLLIDCKRVLVERTQTPMIKALKEWGFKPICCNLTALGSFGGAFHCVTLDIKRKSILETY